MIEPAHIEIVQRNAKRLKSRLPTSVEFDDLVQAGMLGLLGALQTHDPDKGPFGPYAHLRVRGAMVDEVRRMTAWSRIDRRARLVICDPFEVESEANDDNPATSTRDAAILDSAIASLTERDQRFIDLYYRDELKLLAIGIEFGVSESRASQIHADVLEKLRAFLQREATSPPQPTSPRRRAVARVHELEGYPLAERYGWTIYK